MAALRDSDNTEAREVSGYVIDQLYRENWHNLCRRLLNLFGEGPPSPEDVAQEAFSKLTGMGSLDHIDRPKAFLFKVAINIGLKSIARRKLDRSYITAQLESPDFDLDLISPERTLAGKQKLAAVDAGIAQLTDKQRQILFRSRLKGETYAEISAATGWGIADICRQLKVVLKVLEAAAAETDSI